MPRFAVDGEVVTDCLTGLIWSGDANPAQYPVGWHEAFETTAAMNRGASLPKPFPGLVLDLDHGGDQSGMRPDGSRLADRTRALLRRVGCGGALPEDRTRRRTAPATLPPCRRRTRSAGSARNTGRRRRASSNRTGPGRSTWRKGRSGWVKRGAGTSASGPSRMRRLCLRELPTISRRSRAFADVRRCATEIAASAVVSNVPKFNYETTTPGFDAAAREECQ